MVRNQYDSREIFLRHFFNNILINFVYSSLDSNNPRRILMKNKFLTTASTFALVMGFALSANAGCDGLYLAGRGGMAKHDTKSPFIGSKGVDDDLKMFSGALGYRYGYVRTELEYVWRDSVDHKTPGGGGDKWETSSYMWNLYWDLSPYTWFTPYISAGLGFTKAEFVYDAVVVKDSEKHRKFTWSLGGGLSAQVTNRFNIDVGYRYYNIGKFKGFKETEIQEVYGGLRYVF